MRILMMGTGPFAVPTFRFLMDSGHDVAALVTRPVPPARSRRKTPPNPMRDLGESLGLRILAPEDVNAEDARTELGSLESDLLVVCDYGQILSADALRTAPLGGINLHASLLPEYRGAAPINWALLDGRSETGVTVIHMTPKLDGGPCVVQLTTPIHPEEDAVSLESRLAELGVDAVSQAIDRLASWDGETTIGHLQDPKRVTRAPRLKKADGQVDWTRSAQQIFNQVRALKPWPGTYTELVRPGGKGIRLILDQVSVVEQSAAESKPGDVLFSDKDRLLIATGDGVLSLEHVQPAGKRIMKIGEFLRGHAIFPGESLGAASS